MKPINILVVPAWTAVAVKASNNNVGALLDSEKILSILSPSDVGFYYRTIGLFVKYMNEDVLQSLNISQQRNAVLKAVTNTPSFQFNDTLLSSTIALNDPNNEAEFLAFLYKNGGNGCELDNLANKVLGFDVMGYEHEHYILRPIAVDRKELSQCYESLIAKMYDFMPLQEIATSSLFKAYELQLNKVKVA